MSDAHLATIRKYALFNGLVDSSGIVDEQVLDKLKWNIRSILGSEMGTGKDLLDLCLDVIYHNDMKAFGLNELVKCYNTWLETQSSEEDEAE